MTTPYTGFNTRQKPQSEPLPGQVANSAGGNAWEVDDWQKLDRFLILGTEGGTYYIQERELTRDNAEAVIRCIHADGPRTVNRITAISHEGRAVRNDPAIFALALCFTVGDEATKFAARGALPDVCRIGTHLFHFAQYVQNMRGWGRSLKTAVANWYDYSQRDLGYQLVKYQQRDGWSHADLIKLSHPKAHPDLYNWVLGERPDTEGRKHEPVTKPGALPEHRTIQGMVKLHSEFQPNLETQAAVVSAAQIIRDYHLPREAVPTPFLTHKEIWEALLDTDMGYEALVRNLGNMGKVGLLTPLSVTATKVIARLSDEEQLKRSRLHPLKILTAMRQYGAGKGFKGSNEWPVVSQVVDALNAAFYISFNNVESTGKRMMLALDVSGSMAAPLPGVPNMNCREGTAVMAMVTAQAEPNHMFTCFASGDHPSQWGARYNTGIKPLGISPRQRLDDVVNAISGIPFGGTDCALPMLYASEKHLEIDTFVIYTDNETWHGGIHPAQALQRYRQETGIRAQLVVVSMTANPFSIADPNDAGMLDVVGFDTDTPAAISEFQRA